MSKKTEDLSRDLDHIVEIRKSMTDAESSSSSSPSKKTRIIRKPPQSNRKNNKPSRSLAAFEETSDIKDNKISNSDENEINKTMSISSSNNLTPNNKSINYLDKLEYSQEYSMLLSPDASQAHNDFNSPLNSEKNIKNELSLNSSLNDLSLNSSINDIEPSTPNSKRNISSIKTPNENQHDFTSPVSICGKIHPTLSFDEKQSSPQTNSNSNNNGGNNGNNNSTVSSTEIEKGIEKGIEKSLYNEIILKFGNSNKLIIEDIINYFKFENIKSLYDIQLKYKDDGYEINELIIKKLKIKPIPMKRLKSFILHVCSSFTTNDNNITMLDQHINSTDSSEYSLLSPLSPTTKPPSLSNISFYNESNNNNNYQNNLIKDRQKSHTMLKTYAYLYSRNSHFKRWKKKYLVLTNKFLIIYTGIIRLLPPRLLLSFFPFLLIIVIG